MRRACELLTLTATRNCFWRNFVPSFRQRHSSPSHRVFLKHKTTWRAFNFEKRTHTSKHTHTEHYASRQMYTTKWRREPTDSWTCKTVLIQYRYTCGNVHSPRLFFSSQTLPVPIFHLSFFQWTVTGIFLFFSPSKSWTTFFCLSSLTLRSLVAMNWYTLVWVKGRRRISSADRGWGASEVQLEMVHEPLWQQASGFMNKPVCVTFDFLHLLSRSLCYPKENWAFF